MKRPTHFDCYSTERALLNFFGFPIGREKWTLVMVIKGTISLIISFTLIISMGGKIIREIRNLEEILEALYFGLTQTTFLFKIVNILVRAKKFDRLENYLRSDVFNQHTIQQDIHIKRAIAMTGFFARMYRTMVGLTIAFYAVFPFIEDAIPLPGWFPFDTKKYFFVVYFYQLSALLLNGYNHTSLDCITASFISLAAAEFEILKDNLENIGRNIDQRLPIKEQERIIFRRIQISVDHHNVILRFVAEIEDMYSYGIFIQFLCSMIIMCVTGFQVFVMSPSRIQYITLVLYFLCNLNQCAIYSWFGHDILSKSSGIGEACYMGEWNRQSPKVNKCLSIIMERSKIPIILTAGKFFNLTLSTFMMILRTSYSYLAVLQHMYRN